jgi:ketosteroid isomerase-like protein
MSESTSRELLQLTQRLLDSIASGDWRVYQELCDPHLTAFEPEAMGQLVEGLDFHRFYFNLTGSRANRQTIICSPRVRVMGDVGVVTYVRLNQAVGPDGQPFSRVFEETRVWHRQQGGWKHVHFHRSQPATT